MAKSTQQNFDVHRCRSAILLRDPPIPQPATSTKECGTKRIYELYFIRNRSLVDGGEIAVVHTLLLVLD